jgi:hypothetical protein
MEPVLLTSTCKVTVLYHVNNSTQFNSKLYCQSHSIQYANTCEHIQLSS